MNDQKALDETDRLQRETKAAISRMRRQATETHEVGVNTLENLQEQRQTVARMGNETDRLHANLDQTEKLQNKLSRWTLTFNRRRAKKETKKELDLEEAQQDRLKAAKSGNNNQRMTEDQIHDRIVQARERKEMDEAMSALADMEKTSGTGGATGTNTVATVTTSTTNPKKQIHDKPSWQGGSGSSSSRKNPSKSRRPDAKVEQRLNDIDTQDREIDDMLDGFGSQIDGLMSLANQHGQEVRTQDTELNQVYDRIDSANQKQRVVNHRTKGFLFGGGNRKKQ
jgi:hypothetical protein